MTTAATSPVCTVSRRPHTLGDVLLSPLLPVVLLPRYQYAKDENGLVSLSNLWVHPPFTRYPPPLSAPNFADVIRPVTVVKEIGDLKKITNMRRLNEAISRAILSHARTIAVIDGID